MNVSELKNEIKKLKNNKIFNVNVRNSEWFSLFKDEIRNSIAIEGFFANKNELKNVIILNKKTDSHKAAAILGYFESAQTMYDYALNMEVEDEFSIKLSDIKQIHTMLLRYEKSYGYYNGDLGEFRKLAVDVVGSNFKPLNPIYIKDFLKTYVDWINYNIKNKSDEELLRFIAASHVLFETIHPFQDGNGRVGRILLGFLLIGTGFINITIKGTHKKDREKYYEALETADNYFEELLRRFELNHEVATEDLNECSEKSNLSKMIDLLKSGLNASIGILRKDYLLKNAEDEYLPLKQIAEITEYSQDYLRNLINRGKISAKKINNKWHLKLKDIISYMEKLNR